MKHIILYHLSYKQLEILEKNKKEIAYLILQQNLVRVVLIIVLGEYLILKHLKSKWKQMEPLIHLKFQKNHLQLEHQAFQQHQLLVYQQLLHLIHL